MFDHKVLDRTVANKVAPPVYAFCMAVFSVLSVAFVAKCFGIASGWDVSGWSNLDTVLAVAVALAVMFLGMEMSDGFNSVVKSGVGFVLSMGGFAALLAGVMYWLPVDVDMSRVFVLCAMLAVVMCAVNMVMRMLKMESMVSWGLGALLVFVMGLVCEWLFGLGWLSTMLGWVDLSAAGGLTRFDWVCWVVFGMLVVVSMTRGMQGRTVRDAVDGGASVFCCRL